MAEFKISTDLSDVSAIRGIIDERVFPRLKQAVDFVAQQTRIDWLDAIRAARLWAGEKETYAKSVTMTMRTDKPFAAVVESDYRYAEQIEEGRPARDLKLMLNTSLKVRRAKDGRRFLIIPLRYNTPGHDAIGQAMPAEVYAAAKNLKPSRVVGTSHRPSGEITSLHGKWGMRALKKQQPFLSNPATRGAMMVPKLQYKWGEKLDGPGKYAGMYRFDTTTPGGVRSSTYMTFRVMMEGQSGWIVPAQPGIHIVQRVVAQMQPKAEAAFRKAMTLL